MADHASQSVTRFTVSLVLYAAQRTTLSSLGSPHLAVLRILIEVSDVMDRPTHNSTRSPRLLCLADRG